MAMLGFSINMVTLFGMVLAIGIVVDDAIVVVENVERNMSQLALGPKEAAIKAMEEVTGPIIGITLVLMAVFVPAAFMGGITGELYRQFSLTIAITTFFSAINALTLSPALCAILLRSAHGRKNIFFRAFNRVFDRITHTYSNIIGISLRRVGLAMVVFTGLVALTVLGFIKVPTGFVPLEDDGLILVNVQDAGWSESRQNGGNSPKSWFNFIGHGRRGQLWSLRGLFHDRWSGPKPRDLFRSLDAMG